MCGTALTQALQLIASLRDALSELSIEFIKCNQSDIGFGNQSHCCSDAGVFRLKRNVREYNCEFNN